jgi:hypothetical protein
MRCGLRRRAQVQGSDNSQSAPRLPCGVRTSRNPKPSNGSGRKEAQGREKSPAETVYLHLRLALATIGLRFGNDSS